MIQVDHSMRAKVYDTSNLISHACSQAYIYIRQRCLLLRAVVAAGLVGYIGYKIYTGEGKHSPMSTIGMLLVYLWRSLGRAHW